MGSKVDVPATTDPTSTDWQNFIAWVEKSQVGKINITFSNMDNTSEPKIQAGSIVEIAGSLYSFNSEEAATGWSGIANSTQAYMRLVPSGDTVSAEWTTTAPTYRDDLQGWYESGTNKRYVLGTYKDDSGDYTGKSKVEDLYYGINVFGGIAHFYANTDYLETNLPIGSIVLSVTDGISPPARNYTVSLYTKSGSNIRYTISAGQADEEMSGEWRIRGVGDSTNTVLVQRVY